MEELLEKIQSSLEVNSLSNFSEVGESSKRFSQYKYKDKPFSLLDTRRKQILEEQKKRRDEVLNNFRGLLDKVLSEGETCMEWSNVQKKKTRLFKLGKEFCSQIMFSEWFLDLPCDFKTNWCFKACPKGHRKLLVAKNGQTQSFSKNGRLIRNFHTNLVDKSCKDLIVLDCIHNDVTDTYYTLDVLHWKFPMMSSTAEFRFYWLATKMSEINQKPADSKYSYAKVTHLPAYSTSALEDLLRTFPLFPDNSPELDGLLFYHKQSFYEPGRTPLVGWVKPFMVPNILGVTVDEGYLAGSDCDVVKLMEKENKHYYKKCRKKQENNMVTERPAEDMDDS